MTTSDQKLVALANQLPLPLAVVLTEYVQEDVPFIKLHRLTDAAEVLTRFVAIVLLSDFVRLNGGFPKKLRLNVNRLIKEPTFGQWKQLVALGKEHLPTQEGHVECFVSGLPDFVEHRLLPVLGPSEKVDASREIIPMRNSLVHAGRIPDTLANEWLHQHRERFENLLGGLNFLNQYSLLGVSANGQLLTLRVTCPRWLVQTL